MKPESSTISPNDDRDAQIASVIEAVIRQRSLGHPMPDSEAIATNPTLMPELGRKLHALSRVEQAEERAYGTDHPDRPSAQLPRDSLPGYDLMEEIHRGGQGVVYRATQIATRRQVAVKVTREGPFLGPRDKARFDREIRILAKLKHPNIVTIHDSGMAAGSHCFVMDYIDGRPLDAHLADRTLSVESALRLFLKICDAVNAAHLRGIIHRDLKPGNILIDKLGEPHILDFGLAKFASEELEDATQWRAVTMTGQFVGSLPWASPEQADGSIGQIDLRTDVYSLGVVLYHMLTGDFPYPIVGNMRDVLTNITTVDPIRPSSLRREIDEDVEIILLKCLAKEPERRYQNAAALAEDIRRYLSNQPILARAPSTVYQLRMLIVRHKLPSILLATLFSLVTFFAVWMSVLYGRTAIAEKRAQEQRAEAVRESQTAQAVNDFLINDMLASADPSIARGRKIAVEEVLANAATRIQSAFADQPLVEASVRTTMGQAYISLGLYADAEAQLRVAASIRSGELGDDHPDTLRTRVWLVAALRLGGKYDQARGLAEPTMESARRLFGPDHEITLSAEFQWAWLLKDSELDDESTELHRQILDRRRKVLGDDHPDTIASANVWGDQALARKYITQGAEAMFTQILENSRRVLGDDHPETLKAMAILGEVLTMQRELVRGESLLREALAGQVRVIGEEHPSTLGTAWVLSRNIKEQDRVDEAQDILERAVRIARSIHGDEQRFVQDMMMALANLYIRHRDYVRSAHLHKEILDICRSLYRDDDWRTASSFNELGAALGRLERHAEAEPNHRHALGISLREFGPDHRNSIRALRLLVRALAAQGKAAEARPFAEKLIEIRRRIATTEDTDAYKLNCCARALLEAYPADLRDPKLALEFALRAYDASNESYHYNRYTLARAYEANGDLDRAVELARIALTNIPLEDSAEHFEYEAALVSFLEEQGAPRQAEQVYRDTLAARREHFPENHPDIAYSLEELGETLMRHGKHAEAEPLLRECLSIRKAALPQEHWRIADAMSALGAALSRQARFEQAEPLLREAYTRLLDIPYAPLDRTERALERLNVLYQAWPQSAGYAENSK